MSAYTDTHTHTHTGPIAVPGPLNRSAIKQRKKTSSSS